jgi:1,4-alpha-glucan branching enzyme
VRDHRIHRSLGAHPKARGVSFAVWAPAARAVHVVSDADDWQPHPLERDGEIWRGEVDGVGVGAHYFFELLGADGVLRRKADPCARQAELRPGRASIVASPLPPPSFFDRPSVQHRPMSVYEVHLGSFRRAADGSWLGYRDLDPLIDHAVDLGFTHLEIMPLMEHPLDRSWGYQVTSYFAPTSRYGPPEELRAFVDRCHAHDLGVIFDWVPAHFPKDAFGLSRFDGTPLYEHADPRRGDHRQWGTHVFDYGKPGVRSFLVSSALRWLEDFGGDGLRCDAVASMIYLDYAARHRSEWLPNAFGGREHLEAIAFLRELGEVIRSEVPGALFIAEESTAWPGVTHAARSGGLGFDLKWNMGWMHDTLAYFALDPIHRSHHHDRITFGLIYGFDERFVLPLSHDEVVHEKRSLLAKMPGDRWQRFANLRAFYGHMWAHPGKKLLFMGGEIGMEREWSEERAIDWALVDGAAGAPHRGLMALVRDLNRLYRDHAALHRFDHDPQGFRWIDASDTSQSVISYLRLGDPEEGSLGARDHVICLGNFTPVVRHGYRVGVPRRGAYREILNTDAHHYGGSGVHNGGPLEATDVPAHGMAQSLELTLPPLAVLYLAPEVGGGDRRVR